MSRLRVAGKRAGTAMTPAIEVTAEPAAGHVAPGEQIAINLVVQNEDAAGHDCRVAIVGLPREWYDLDTPRLAIDPGGTERLCLAVHPPEAGDVLSGLYPVGIRVTADDDPTIHASAIVDVVVGVGPALGMEVTPFKVTGRTATFHVTVQNRMAWPATVALDVHDKQEALQFNVRPSSLMVIPAGAARTVDVEAVPAGRKRGTRPQTFDIEFDGRLAGQPDGPAAIACQARITYAPRNRRAGLSSWGSHLPFRAIVGVLIVGLLAVAVMRTTATRGRQTAAVPTAMHAVSALRRVRHQSHRVARPGVPAAIPSGAALRSTPLLKPVVLSDLLLNPDRISIGRSGSAATIHVVNLSASPLRIVRIAVVGKDAPNFVARSTCTRKPIDAESGCTISVRFTNRAGTARRALLVMTVPGAHKVQSVALTGGV